jgi:hypothetical protein
MVRIRLPESHCCRLTCMQTSEEKGFDCCNYMETVENKGLCDMACLHVQRIHLVGCFYIGIIDF